MQIEKYKLLCHIVLMPYIGRSDVIEAFLMVPKALCAARSLWDQRKKLHLLDFRNFIVPCQSYQGSGGQSRDPFQDRLNHYTIDLHVTSMNGTVHSTSFIFLLLARAPPPPPPRSVPGHHRSEFALMTFGLEMQFARCTRTLSSFCQHLAHYN